jgi:hypothetical protein
MSALQKESLEEAHEWKRKRESYTYYAVVAVSGKRRELGYEEDGSRETWVGVGACCERTGIAQ